MRNDDWLRVLGAVAGVAVAGAAAVAARRALAVDIDEALERLDANALQGMVAVGAVGERDARVWLRSPARGAVVLTIRQGLQVQRVEIEPHWDEAADGTTSILLSDAGVGLEPGLEVQVAVEGADGSVVGEARFHTDPGQPVDHLSIAVLSCHDPFYDDGSRNAVADGFLASLRDAFDALGVRGLVMMGDQVYTDLPATLSLFREDFFRRVGPDGRDSLLTCSREEVREVVQRRYRQFWGGTAFARLQSSFATATAADDHEIVDNYGSTAEHDTDAWRTVAAGALDAYHDYQTSRSLPERPACFDQEFQHAQVAMRILDLRSERVTDGERTRILSDAQLARLDAFLERSRDREVVIIGLSVPLLHVSEALIELGEVLNGDGGDFSDRWNRQKSLPCRDALLRRLHDFQCSVPRCRLVIVGGDVHVGAFGEVVWDTAGIRPLRQLVTSPVSNQQPVLHRALAAHGPAQVARVGPEDARGLARLMPATSMEGDNPQGGLNAGVVEIRRVDGHSEVRFRLLGPSDEGPQTLSLTDWF